MSASVFQISGLPHLQQSEASSSEATPLSVDQQVDSREAAVNSISLALQQTIERAKVHWYHCVNLGKNCFVEVWLTQTELKRGVCREKFRSTNGENKKGETFENVKEKIDLPLISLFHELVLFAAGNVGRLLHRTRYNPGRQSASDERPPRLDTHIYYETLARKNNVNNSSLFRKGFHVLKEKQRLWLVHKHGSRIRVWDLWQGESPACTMATAVPCRKFPLHRYRDRSVPYCLFTLAGTGTGTGTGTRTGFMHNVSHYTGIRTWK